MDTLIKAEEIKETEEIQQKKKDIDKLIADINNDFDNQDKIEKEKIELLEKWLEDLLMGYVEIAIKSENLMLWGLQKYIQWLELFTSFLTLYNRDKSVYISKMEKERHQYSDLLMSMCDKWLNLCNITQKVLPTASLSKKIEIINIEYTCGFLFACAEYFEKQKIESKMKNEVEKLILENMEMLEAITNSLQENRGLIQKLKEKFKIKNTEDVIELYKISPNAFEPLDKYYEKIQEIYGPTDILLSVSFYDCEEIVLKVEKTFSMQEAQEKNKQMISWQTKNKDSHIIVNAFVDESYIDDLLKEIKSGF